MWFAHIEQEVILARVLLLLERGHVDLLDTVDLRGIAGRRLDAAELVIVYERGHGRMGAAYRAIRVLAQFQLAEAHGQRIHQQQPPDQRLAHTQDQFDDLGCLDTPTSPGRMPSTPPSAQEGTKPGGGGSG